MATLFIHRKPSYRLATILGLAHCIAGGLLWPLDLSLNIKLIVVFILMMSAIYYLRQDAFLVATNSVIAFELSNTMRCTIISRSGQSIICCILSSTYVTSYLTVLNVKPEGKFFTRSILILPDGIDTEAFRQLRVWLRWKWKKID
jgi:toxin CptA